MMKKNLLVILFFTGYFAFSQSNEYQKIDSLLLKGRYREAFQSLSSLEDSFRRSYTMASIYHQLDKTEKAIEYYHKALAIQVDYQSKVKLGRAYQKVKKLDLAIKVYEEIIDADPKNLLIQYQLGKLYLRKRKANKAIKVFEELCGVDASNPNYSYQKGVAYAMKKKRDLMINSFLKAYLTDSTHVKSIHQLANSYFKLEDTDSTYLFLEKGLKVSPHHIQLNQLMAKQTFKDGNYDKALEVLMKLDTLTPNEFLVVNMIGRVYYNTEKYKESKKYFKRLRQIEPTNYKVMTYLGHIEMRLGNYQEAKTNYMMARIIGKVRMDEEFYGLGHVNLKLNKPKEALKMFEKSYKENRNNYLSLYQLAKTSDDYYKDKKKAYRLYNQYLLEFDDQDLDLTAYAKMRVKKIKKEYFLKGDNLEE